jgi:hypothetical protein
MSSWAKPVKIQPKRVGYSQENPQGRFLQKTKPVTVVSAFYQVTSPADKETYKQRMRLFLENLPCHLIFFTDAPFVDFVKECRKNFLDRTIIMPLNRTEWVANIKYNETMWQTQLEKDPEKSRHTVDQYKLWYEKKEFVLTAIELNPYDHNDFIWMDACIISEEAIIPLISANFPVSSRIPMDRMLLLNVNPFTVQDEDKANNITGNFENKDRIAAGIIAGNMDNWLKWSDLYDTTMNRYLEAGMFVGKEQNIMSSMVLENKEFISLVNPPKNFGKKWLYLLIYLGVSDRRFKVLSSFAGNSVESYQSIASLYP